VASTQSLINAGFLDDHLVGQHRQQSPDALMTPFFNRCPPRKMLEPLSTFQLVLVYPPADAGGHPGLLCSSISHDAL
jgi:hypothetical protein